MDRLKEKSKARKRYERERRIRLRWYETLKQENEYGERGWQTQYIIRRNGREYWREILEAQQQRWNTKQSCSCTMCGNPRKHFNEITIQEKIFIQQMLEQLEELYETEDDDQS